MRRVSPGWREEAAPSPDYSLVPVEGKEVVLFEKGKREGRDEGEILELLAFRLSTEEYALEIRMIKEIIKPQEVTRVPRVPVMMKGVISLRGAIIPILDLRTRLGLAEAVPTRKTRFLVLAVEEDLCGLVVDEVTEVIRVTQSELEPPPQVMGGAEGEYIRGVVRVKDRLIILLEPQRVITVMVREG